jgi:hypothetical protein
LRIDDASDDDRLQELVDATNGRVRGWNVARLSLTYGTPPPVWPPDVVLGTTMLAARLWRRKDSPAGVEPMGDAFAFVAKSDPDISMMLRIGAWAGPGVG